MIYGRQDTSEWQDRFGVDPKVNPDSIYELIHKRGGGIVTLGRNRGLFYASRNAISGTPPGWLFIATEDDRSPAEIAKAVEEYRDALEHEAVV